jgi:hypothetical protein
VVSSTRLESYIIRTLPVLLESYHLTVHVWWGFVKLKNNTATTLNKVWICAGQVHTYSLRISYENESFLSFHLKLHAFHFCMLLTFLF